MNLIIGIVTLIFILLTLSSIILISLSGLNGKVANISKYVKISIIISARNEKENVKNLINNLNILFYPQDSFEIIIVDDNSTDITYAELKKQTARLGNLNIKVLRLIGLSGKREALSFGIQHSQYPFILITDADCQPQRNWLKAYSEKFEYGYEILFGVAPFYQNKKLINRISCFENLRSSLLSFSMALLGLPYTAAARNFGFTRKAFDLLGGYSKTTNTVSGDDDLLLREAIKNKLKIGTVTESDSFVYSETKKSFGDYLQQRARHTQSSFHYLKLHQSILGFWHLLNLLFFFSPFLIFINPLYGFLFPAKLLIDFVVIISSQKKFDYKFSVLEIIYLQIFYEILLIVHFLNARFSKIKWK